MTVTRSLQFQVHTWTNLITNTKRLYQKPLVFLTIRAYEIFYSKYHLVFTKEFGFLYFLFHLI